ncbi:23S rRNA (guanosine(2251)-2'-O)-methyltransferase RlmB [Sessilibacter corallicola]|uniref:23S rRNA (guanosine(2251)-2'-O)-methyltransferase RlmB n=1 Tax=Sessilibacter corallicola TaxID=2904075 RepID=UPI001E516EA9|nr:23S rRNA (guanosine(2251)-2'-O)-methyltransferase RlmB [Sessilibacter corallicola]MCE2028942.1 23S rRNA (guanosine(2251)-2'-O)-methyltransferase RlmB [Sessilibacter corallicola]
MAKNNSTSDSQQYLEKKALFRSLLTVYGRKPVLEALQAPETKPIKLHLAESNKESEIIREILALAENKNAEIIYHTRQALSRISKNSKQDQGVCVDIQCPNYLTDDQFISANKNKPFELIALDGISNPQNLGMIIRSATAGFIDGIILPEKGCAQIDPLVIKASAGSVFKAPIVRCENLTKTLEKFKSACNTKVIGLSLDSSRSIADINTINEAKIFVLGNETSGVSQSIEQLSDYAVKIPMNNNVESLNVAVTAALLSFRSVFNS